MLSETSTHQNRKNKTWMVFHQELPPRISFKNTESKVRMLCDQKLLL